MSQTMLKNTLAKAVDYYNDLDILDETVLASQCVKVNDEEIDILKEKA